MTKVTSSRSQSLGVGGGVEYIVKTHDTLEGIAARYDCTPTQLLKMNKLPSRLLFPGQKIIVPAAARTEQQQQETPNSSAHHHHHQPRQQQQPASGSTDGGNHSKSRDNSSSSSSTAFTKTVDSIPAPSSSTLPLSSWNTSSAAAAAAAAIDAAAAYSSSNIDNYSSGAGGSATADQDQGAAEASKQEDPSSSTGAVVVDPQLDADCLQRFLKIRCKHFTDNEGVVSGVLLVTPNCVMFDPDVSHPLVIENGADQYGMVVAMDTIVSAALYKDASVLVDEYNERQAGEQRLIKPDGNTVSYVKHPSGSNQFATTAAAPENLTIRTEDDRNIVPPPQPSDSSIQQQEQATTSAADAKRAELDVELAGLSLEPDAKTVLRRHVSDSAHIPRDGDGKSSSSAAASSSLLLGTTTTTTTTIPRPQAANSCPSQMELRHLAGGSKEGPLLEATTTDDDGNSLRSGGGGVTSARETGNKRQSSVITPKRASLSKLQHSLRERANTLGGTLVHGAQAVGSGVGTIGGSLVHGAHAVGDTLSTSAKAVVKVPQNLVNMSSGLFAARSPQAYQAQSSVGGGSTDVLDIQESWFSTDEAGNKAAEQMRKKQENYALLARLQQRTAEARQHWMNMFACATSKDEHPLLFAPVEDLLPYPHQLYSDLCTELPYYLCIRLDEKRRQRRMTSRDSKEDYEFGNKTKTEFWFTVPRDKADTLYAFLIQWTPDLSEEEGESSATPTAITATGTAAAAAAAAGTPQNIFERRYTEEDSVGKNTGFVVLDVNDDDGASIHDTFTIQPGSLPASLSLNREWEIVTVEEVKRRLSLLDLLEAEPQPLPEGCHLSGLLDEDKVRALMEVLPARAQGYPWALVYSSETHGFSLRTLYRNMQHWGEEVSPTLLAIKDTNGHVFGAVVNCPLRVSEHFYGSGESLLFTFYPEFAFYRWTGANSFIVKGNNDSLSFGAGRGVYGLWLDGDLYHGRTQQCQTFDNVPLTAGEDFIIAGVEAWGFSLSGI